MPKDHEPSGNSDKASKHIPSFLVFGERIISERFPKLEWVSRITETLITGKSPEPQIPIRKMISDLQHIVESKSLERLPGLIEDLQRIQNEQQQTNQEALDAAKKIEEIADTGRKVILGGNPSGNKTKAVIIASGATVIGLAGIGITIAVSRRLKNSKTHD